MTAQRQPAAAPACLAPSFELRRPARLLLTGTALDDFGHSPSAETALLEFDTSEFGRFRLQYTHDQSDLKPYDEILFQYTVIYGPHGAHRY